LGGWIYIHEAKRRLRGWKGTERTDPMSRRRFQGGFMRTPGEKLSHRPSRLGRGRGWGSRQSRRCWQRRRRRQNAAPAQERADHEHGQRRDKQDFRLHGPRPDR
jgi:hypothetical protein